ncbi:hypothetical protein DAI22_01g468050 [Oryza sativa Japonica Group]|nr:hypothetical protein DAI22_01g468050 [Oryza sativa Japonica Group]
MSSSLRRLRQVAPPSRSISSAGLVFRRVNSSYVDLVILEATASVSAPAPSPEFRRRGPDGRIPSRSVHADRRIPSRRQPPPPPDPLSRFAGSSSVSSPRRGPQPASPGSLCRAVFTVDTRTPSARQGPAAGRTHPGRIPAPPRPPTPPPFVSTTCALS